jgi:hypothetical protein
MKAVAKLLRVKENGEEIAVDRVMAPFAITTLTKGYKEKAVVRLWHGNCLEAEVLVQSLENGDVIVKLIDKKELRKDAPPEATC